MDARERMGDFEEVLRAAIEAHQARTWTSLPGKILSYNREKQTATIQPSVKSFVKNPDGSQKAVDLPVLEDVPVQQPGGGGMMISLPVKPGDEVLINFSSRSADSWQQSGGEQVAPDASMNSLSAGFAMLGFRSNPGAAKVDGGTDPDALQIRSEDGKTKIGVSAAGGVAVDTDKSVAITAAAGVAMSGGAGNITFTGDLIVTGDVIAGGVSLRTHLHTGTTPGGGTSGPPET